MSRAIVFMISVIIAAIWITIGTLIFKDTNTGVLMFDIKTKSMPYPFTIQNVMWVVFFIGFGELFIRLKDMLKNKRALNAKYLVEEPNIFIVPKDLKKIRQDIHSKNDILAKLIKTLITRFQVSQNSIDETHQMLTSQIELMQYKVDINYNMIRFIVWLIPTLGFIGTVVGIANTLSQAGIPGAAEQPDFLNNLTSSLAVSFNTTLLSLILSSILVFIMHIILEYEESIIQRSGEYCLNNLINKLIIT